MDSPKQAAFGLKAGKVVFENDSLLLEFPSLQVRITGNLTDDKLETQFQQAGMNFPIEFIRTVAEPPPLRPQDPKPPFPYAEKEVRFRNENAGIQLAGTLTYLQDQESPAAVVMISGSGAQNRDEEIFNHRPFAVWADQLSRAGIAVLRFDERGVGASEGTFTTATSSDFAADVDAAIAFLQNESGIKPSKIGLIGHSEGGIIAPMVATSREDIDFVVLLAGPGVPSKDLMLLQNEKLMASQGLKGNTLKKLVEQKEILIDLVIDQADAPKADLEKAILKYYEDLSPGIDLSQNETIQRAIQQLSNPWMRFFLAYDPTENLRALSCPVLAVNGDKDLQVVSEQNLPAIEKALKAGGNKDFTTKNFPGLNHLFQAAERGTVDEYATIEETVNTEVLTYVTDWIQQRIKNK
jgi:pimeloyl-ACP methyl ester carboxylesterase